MFLANIKQVLNEKVHCGIEWSGRHRDTERYLQSGFILYVDTTSFGYGW